MKALGIPILASLLAAPLASAQNLLSNGDFPPSSTAPWTAELPDRASIEWTPADYLGSVDSGSAQITNSSPFGGDGQGVSTCAGAVTAGVFYEWGGFIYFPSGQTRNGDAQVGLRFKSGPDCTGADLSQPRQSTIAHDAWTLRRAHSQAPVGAVSVQFVAFTSKVEAAGTLVALFDHLFIQESCPGKPKGDVNADTLVNVQDVFALINSLFASAGPTVCSANVNGDGATDVLDVFYLINYLFANGPEPQ